MSWKWMNDLGTPLYSTRRRLSRLRPLWTTDMVSGIYLLSRIAGRLIIYTCLFTNEIRIEYHGTPSSTHGWFRTNKVSCLISRVSGLGLVSQFNSFTDDLFLITLISLMFILNPLRLSENYHRKWILRYGGPESQLVDLTFRRDWHHYVACSLQYIVVIIDGRGTGFKGRKLRNPVKGNLGFFETIDQIAAAKWAFSLIFLHCLFFPWLDKGDWSKIWGPVSPILYNLFGSFFLLYSRATRFVSYFLLAWFASCRRSLKKFWLVLPNLRNW